MKRLLLCLFVAELSLIAADSTKTEPNKPTGYIQQTGSEPMPYYTKTTETPSDSKPAGYIQQSGGGEPKAFYSDEKK